MSDTYLRQEIFGGVPATELAGDINASVETIEIADATNWPDGSGGPFVIKINRTGFTEESVLILSRSGTTLTVKPGRRGYDRTTASAHFTGERVEHVISGHMLDQMNRFVNLMTAVGQLIGFNGTNPVVIGAGDTNEMVLQVDDTDPTGLSIGRLPVFTIDPSAPSVTGMRRLWFDETLNALRVSDGSEWLFQAGALMFASEEDRDEVLAAPIAGLIVATGTGDSLQVTLHDGDDFIRLATGNEGIIRFANELARDAYFDPPLDGDHGYLLSNSTLTEYRNSEWIVINHKVTVATVAPTSGRQPGDVWLQPD